jgi:biotin carboxyl carrier protein
MIFDATVLGRTQRVEVHGKDGRYRVSLDGEELEVSVSDAGAGFSVVRIGARSHELGLVPRPNGYEVVVAGLSLMVELAEATRGDAAPSPHVHGPARLLAPMPGRVVRVLSPAGARVEAGQGLVVIEAMKMENELRAPRAGCLRELLVREGQAVEAGALLAVVA